MVEKAAELQLVLPSELLADQYSEMCADYIAHGELMYNYSSPDLVIDRIRFEIQLSSDNRPAGRVKCFSYWFMGENNRLIGTSKLRPVLNEAFSLRGGNIGFDVCPSYRRMGFATRILSMTLQKAKSCGLSEALLTCNEENTGSWKTIEKNGGRIENLVEDERTGKRIRRYWIKL
jgi:predicted acetyltransferase